MPEATPVVTTTDAIKYQPLSVLALLAVGLGVLAPLSLLSIHPAMFALPFLGFVVSLMAYRRIAQAEGTLAGRLLAVLGLGLSLESGLAWLAMYGMTVYVIEGESRAFADEWVEKVRQGKEGEAFLDTMAPKTRKISFAPSDIKKLRTRFPAKAGYNEYDMFRALPLNAALLRYGDQLEWLRRGVVEFGYDKESYKVRHRYQIATTDGRIRGTIDLLTTSEIVPTSHGPRREWKMNVHGGLDTDHPTPYMVRLTEAEGDALKALDYWLADIAADRRDKALARLTAPDDPLRQAEFDHLYKALRNNAPAQSQAEVRRGEQPATLIKDSSPDGKSWRLTYRGDFSRDWQWDVESQFTLVTDNLEKGREGWRLEGCKYLGEHRKVGRMLMTPGAETKGVPGGPGS